MYNICNGFYNQGLVYNIYQTSSVTPNDWPKWDKTFRVNVDVFVTQILSICFYL